MEEASSSACTIFVIGEFKKGKSSLVNGLVGVAACPVAVDLTTELPTAVVHGTRTMAAVWEDGSDRRREIPWEEAATLISEPQVMSGAMPRRIELAVESAFLRTGCVLVDTPALALGGSAYGRVSMASLGMAEGVVLVTDASQEYTPIELEAIEAAVAAGAVLVFVLSKVDFYPAWRQVLTLDQAHLDGLGLEAQLLPVSARMLDVARRRSDAQLEADSGYPRLAELLVTDVIQPALRLAAEQSKSGGGASSS